MLVFWSVAGIATALLVVDLVVGDLLGGVLDMTGLADGWLSSTGVLAFLATFGLTGGLLGTSTDLSLLVCALLGVVAGAVVGLGAAAATRALQTGATAHQITAEDYLQRQATVTTSIPEHGVGQVQLVLAGHPTSLAARSAAAVAVGSTVVVTSVISPGMVTVAPPL